MNQFFESAWFGFAVGGIVGFVLGGAYGAFFARDLVKILKNR